MKVTKHGSNYATEAVSGFRCSDCGCEFDIEPGDRMHHVSLRNELREDMKRNRGRVIGTELMEYDSANCPECDRSASSNIVRRWFNLAGDPLETEE